MKKEHKVTRREFMQLSAGFGLVAALGRLQIASAASAGSATAAPDYKALVCVFMFGGNDGHNMVVPFDNTQYAAYTTARGALALPANQLLPINDAAQGAFALHYGLPDLAPLYQQSKIAIVANVGMLVRPTTFADFQNANQLPTNLRSHADQVQQMQTGIPNSFGASGWGGRTVDLMQTANSGTTFPVSISMNGTSLFCFGNLAQAASLQPGNELDQAAFGSFAAPGPQAVATAQQQILAAGSSNSLIQAANNQMTGALALNPLLKAAAGAPTFKTVFPDTDIGNQLKEVARLIDLRSQIGAGRQVFFVGLSGFDTHGGESYQQWALLTQVSAAIAAFYDATVEMGIANNVTSFTLSDFGRTLQPSGSGSDHGWGNHHLVAGGAVAGGKIYGKFPLMTNYANFNSTNEDFADNRGVMLPGLSLSQYGATLAKWFGASDSQLDSVFPTLSNFSVRDLGFLN
ncbi:MAG TPA: DUF1501 domain-containing protein [Blastocatellia bacterium]|nr:DUF1501 domain-containing protein [Blastocatellia bacterium]